MALLSFGSGLGAIAQALTVLIQIIVPQAPVMAPLPRPADGTILAPTQAKAAEAGAYSWTTQDAGPGKFADYYQSPPDGDWLTPDGGVLYATTHFDGATAQAAQETDVAAETYADNQLAVARLDEDTLRLEDPLDSVAGKLGIVGTIGMEGTTATLKNTNLVIQLIQAQADARLREEHERRMAQAYALKFLSGAYVSGTLSWQPDAHGAPGF